MISFKRKYKELSTKSRTVFWITLMLLAVVLTTIVYVLFLSGKLTLRRSYPIQGAQEHVYRNLADFDRITKWLKGLRMDPSTDTLHLTDLDSVVFYNPHNRPVVFTVTRREPFCNVEWNIHINNRDYGVLFYIKYVTDTTSDLCIRVKAPLTKLQALGSFVLIDSIHYHMDRLARELNDYIALQKNNYHMAVESETALERDPYLLVEREVEGQYFTKDLVHYLPDILIYGIKNGLYDRRGKLVMMRFEPREGKIRYATGFPLAKQPAKLPSAYHIGHLPEGKFLSFRIQGDYLYHPYARTKAKYMLKAKGYRYDTGRPFVYRYLTGHSKYPKNPEKWETVLYMPVKNQ